MDPQTIPCRHCGGPVPVKPPHRAGPQTKYCSTRCRILESNDRARADGRMKFWLATACAKQKADRRAAMALRSCVECGGPLTKVHQRLYCSDTCANRCAARKARAEGRRNYAREYELDADRSWRRYRSRGRPFRPVEVFERDGWVCYLCGGAIDPMSKRPDPLSPSIDHVHPVSLGGTDDLGNVRAAHLVCNVRKGAKLLSV